MTRALERPSRPRGRLPDCPYVGLTPFDEDDAPFFFGREAERQILVANLMASRLTIVYGPSGVGKTSLLNAGVARDLRLAAKAAAADQRMPESLGVVFNSWSDPDPVARLAERLAEAIQDALGPVAPEPVRAQPLDRLLGAWNERLDEQATRLERTTDLRQPQHVDLLVVLDQFEEYFLYHGDEGGDGTFRDGFERAVNRRGLRANFLVSIREDAYTQLDLFEDAIPNVFASNIRIEHLDRDAAEQAIRGPLRRYSDRDGSGEAPYRAEDELVDVVIEQVQTGAVALGASGRGAVARAPAETSVETSFLQLVMERIWFAERANGSRLLRAATLLDDLGGAPRIVREHLARAMEALGDEREVAARVFGRLVTPRGTKIAMQPSELASVEGVPHERLLPVLAELARTRILRPVPAPGEPEPRYEIFHDVLAPGVLEWRARWLQAREHVEEERRLTVDVARQAAERAQAEAQAERERQVAERERRAARRARRATFVAATFAVLAAGLAAAAVIGLLSARHAKESADNARTAAQANYDLATDPGAALRLALRAARKDHSADALALLRRAALESHLIGVLRGGRNPLATAFTDDRAIVVADANGAIRTWNAVTGHATTVRSMPQAQTAVFSDDGRVLAETDANETVRVVSRTNQPVFSFRTDLAGVGVKPSVVLSPDGRVAAAAIGSTSVPIWRLRRGGWRVGRLHLREEPSLLAVSAKGTKLLLAAARGSAVVDTRTLGRVDIPPLPGKDAVLVAAALSPNGRWVALADDHDAVRVFDARSGKPSVARVIPAAVTAVAFGPGERLAIGAADGRVELWTARTRAKPSVLTGHTDAVTSVTFSRDGGWLVTTSSDRTARIWIARTGAAQATFLGHTDAVTGATLSRDGARIATTSEDGTVRLWRVPRQRPLVTLPLHLGEVGYATFSADGKLVLTSSVDRSVILASSGSGQRLHTFGTPTRLSNDWRRYADRTYGVRTNNAVFAFEPAAALSADGTRVVTADEWVGGATLWNAKTGKLERRLLPKGTWAEAVFYGAGPQKRWFGLVTGPPGLRLFDAEDGSLRGKLRDGAVMFMARFAAAVSADGTYAAAGTLNPGKVEIWNTLTRKRVRELDPGTFSVRYVAIARNGRLVAGSGWGDTAWVWSVRTGQLLYALDLGAPSRALAFSPNGMLLAIAGDARSAQIWDARRGIKVATLHGHTGGINSVAFSPSGRLVVTASDDGTARVWDARTGEVWEAFRQGQPGRALTASFDPSGQRILIAGSDGSSSIYLCDVCSGTRELLRYAQAQAPRSP